MTPTQPLAPLLLTPQMMAPSVDATAPPRRSLEPVVSIRRLLRHEDHEPDRGEHRGEDVPVQGMGGQTISRSALRPPR